MSEEYNNVGKQSETVYSDACQNSYEVEKFYEQRSPGTLIKNKNIIVPENNINKNLNFRDSNQFLKFDLNPEGVVLEDNNNLETKKNLSKKYGCNENLNKKNNNINNYLDGDFESCFEKLSSKNEEFKEKEFDENLKIDQIVKNEKKDKKNKKLYKYKTFNNTCVDNVNININLSGKLSNSTKGKIKDFIEKEKCFDSYSYNTIKELNKEIKDINNDSKINNSFETMKTNKSKTKHKINIIYFNDFGKEIKCKTSDINSKNPLYLNYLSNFSNNSLTFSSIQKNSKICDINEKNEIAINDIESTINNSIEEALPSTKEEELKINKINFSEIGIDEIDINFLKQKLRIIDTRANNIKDPRNKYLKILFEIQNFSIDNSSESPILTVEFDKDCKLLAVGTKSGVVIIFEIVGYDYDKFQLTYTKKNIMELFKFINETPLKILNGHLSDVIDLSWSPFSPLLLSASTDFFVILWNIGLKDNDCMIQKFSHEDKIKCVSFSPFDNNLFITGSENNCLRIYKLENEIFKESISLSETNDQNNHVLNDSNINNDNDVRDKHSVMSKRIKETEKENIFESIHINEKICSISFVPKGDKIIIGSDKGKILVYRLYPNINFDYSFSCKNRYGKNSKGKEINGIKFYSQSLAIISSLDSRIRFVDIEKKITLYKYKGHQNENSSEIKSNIDPCNDIIINGSENGFCYLWHIFNKESNNSKNNSYECFTPFTEEKLITTQIISEKPYTSYFKKILKITNKIFISSIIINSSDKGRLQILLNIDDYLEN